MIEINQWRAVIGTFSQPSSWKCFEPRDAHRHSLRGVLSFILLASLSICLFNGLAHAENHDEPFVDLLASAHDIEKNPGPEVTNEDVLNEIRSFREDTTRQFGVIKSEMNFLKTEMNELREEVEGVKEKVSGVRVDMNSLKETVDLQYQDIDTPPRSRFYRRRKD